MVEIYVTLQAYQNMKNILQYLKMYDVTAKNQRGFNFESVWILCRIYFAEKEKNAENNLFYRWIYSSKMFFTGRFLNFTEN